MNTDVALLRSFIEVARTSSFGQAAEALHLDPSTVSRQVGQLERRLGIALFERTTRQVWLTPAGAALLGSARDAVAAVDRFGQSAAAVDRQERGEIAIGFQTHSVNGEMLAMISASQEATGVRSVRLVEGNFTDPSTGLHDRSTDLAFVFTPFRTDGLELRPLFELPWLAFVPSDHPLAAESHVHLRDLFEESWIFPDSDDDIYVDYWTATDLRDGVPAVDAPRYASAEAALALIATGRAVGVGASVRGRMHLEGVTVLRVADRRRTGVALGWVTNGLSDAAVRLRDDLLARLAATDVRPRWASAATPSA